jgi:nucleotide-binding universal stress UspA family protein
MFRNILIANDLSDASRPALQAGLELARVLGARVSVLYVTMPAYPVDHCTCPTSAREAAVLQALSDREQEAAAQLWSRACASSAGDPASVSLQIKVGAPAEVILDGINELKVDLVVVGTHGRHGVERLILGSTAEKIARKAPCSVLTVHPSEVKA